MRVSATTSDVLIVGAGVIGTSIALQVARSGRSVTVVDKGGGAGHGSTSASAAIIRFHYSTRAGIATAWESKFCWQNWADFLGHVDPAGMAKFTRTGALVMDFPGFDTERVLGLYAELGIPFERLTAAGIQEKFPYVAAGRHYPPKALEDPAFWDDADAEIGGFWTPEGGFMDDPMLAAHNFLHAAQQEGARVRFHTTISGVVREGDRVTGLVTSEGERLEAPVVVNAAGPWSTKLNQMAGVLDDFNVTTRALRQEVHHVPAPPGAGIAQGMPMVADGDLAIYFRPEPGGDILIGGQEPKCDPLVWVDDPDDVDVQPTMAVYEAQATRVARRLPELPVPPRPRGVVGVYDVSDDWIPILDRTGLDGFYVAIGTSGNSFKSSPVYGQIMATLINACEGGHDHDHDPVQFTCPRTGLTVDLRHYSRLREVNDKSSFSVMG